VPAVVCSKAATVCGALTEPDGYDFGFVHIKVRITTHYSLYRAGRWYQSKADADAQSTDACIHRQAGNSPGQCCVLHVHSCTKWVRVSNSEAQLWHFFRAILDHLLVK
jgi:hypothetical protein